MADPTRRRRRARVSRDEDRDDDASPPPPPPRPNASSRRLLVVTLATIAGVGIVKLLWDEHVKSETESALVDSLMPLPVDRADCDRWVRRETETFSRTAFPDGAADGFDRTIVDAHARGAENRCFGLLVGKRIPKSVYHCLSNETDYGRLLRCSDEAVKDRR
jgi:hypothetical protein